MSHPTLACFGRQQSQQSLLLTRRSPFVKPQRTIIYIDLLYCALMILFSMFEKQKTKGAQ
jgi:hypothetical protein